MRDLKTFACAAAAVLALGVGSAAAATATIKNPEGKELGTVTLTQSPNGVLLEAELRGLPPGEHGFHIHEKGACSPDFKAAGGHFAGGAEKHGFLVEGGPHAGDMPNIVVPESGMLAFDVFNPNISLEGGDGNVLDDDGSAIMIHAGADDYESQPSGDAGDRIGCGVIEK